MSNRPDSQPGLRLYSVFHLNLAYSSIEEEQRKEVLQKCYWPLLRMIEKLEIPAGIEASGHTLEVIESLDPTWISKLSELLVGGGCELIGSGYAQLIGPLVPARVNLENLKSGREVYERLLGRVPDLALVNEQAYSAGLIGPYREAGFRALIMEWDNPARYHPEWDPEWSYLPQRISDAAGRELFLIWNNSISFQKFQRFAHDELGIEEYLAYLDSHRSATPRAFPLYGNDVEIFDFRPGRFSTEAALDSRDSEWERISQLYRILRDLETVALVRPSQVLDLLCCEGAGEVLRLESPQQPVPVKKQGKYNITRWAVTGRDDLKINSGCWRAFQALEKSHQAKAADWKELCYLWSSDFRTHITQHRWDQFQRRLKDFLNRVGSAPSGSNSPALSKAFPEKSFIPPAGVRLRKEGRYLGIETEDLALRLNCRRGLTIQDLTFKKVSGEPLVGTLPHGYFTDISLGADFYSGHVVMEAPGRPKVTDLVRAQPRFSIEGGDLCIETDISTELGLVHKQMRVPIKGSSLELRYRLNWAEFPPGSLRLGFVTLLPEAFDKRSLSYASHNGGELPEAFSLEEEPVHHGAPVSFLVSAGQAVGLTQGQFEMGDSRTRVRVEVDKSISALVGLVHYCRVGPTFFCRLELSAMEMDETTRPRPDGQFEAALRIGAYMKRGKDPIGEDRNRVAISSVEIC